MLVGLETGPILVHNVDCGIWADLLGEEVEYPETARNFIGHHKMSYEKPLFGKPVFDLQVADLSVHLLYRGKTDFGVIGQLRLKTFSNRYLFLNRKIIGKPRPRSKSVACLPAEAMVCFPDTTACVLSQSG
jgi:hypothetical protein